MFSPQTVQRWRSTLLAVGGLLGVGAGVTGAAGASRWLALALLVAAVAVGLCGLVLLRMEHRAEDAEQRNIRERAIDERYARACEALGEVSTVGAIFALEQIMREARARQGVIVELLTAFIRERATAPAGHDQQSGSTDSRGSRPRPAVDVQAALTVLGRRNPDWDDRRVQLRLSGVDLRGASFRDGHFARVRLRRAQLQHAHFEGADLEGAKLRQAGLEGADFGGDTELGLEPACLKDASLVNADLRGAKLAGTDLSGANLAGADVRGARCDSDTQWPAGFDFSAGGATAGSRRPPLNPGQ
jgi:hypothetical protein